MCAVQRESRLGHWNQTDTGVHPVGANALDRRVERTAEILCCGLLNARLPRIEPIFVTFELTWLLEIIRWTPDIRFEAAEEIFGGRYHWIEIKSGFSYTGFSLEKRDKSVQKYAENFGRGLVIHMEGFLQGYGDHSNVKNVRFLASTCWEKCIDWSQTDDNGRESWQKNIPLKDVKLLRDAHYSRFRGETTSINALYGPPRKALTRVWRRVAAECAERNRDGGARRVLGARVERAEVSCRRP